MNRRGGHGLQNLVIGAALLLAAAVLFHAAKAWRSRSRAPGAAAGPAAPARIASDHGQPMPGASAPRETPTVLPPLLIRRTSRASPSVGGKKAPPAPVLPRERR